MYIFLYFPKGKEIVLVLVAIRIYHRLCGLNNKNVFITVLGSLRSRHQQIWCLVRALFLLCRQPVSSCVPT